MILSRFVDAKFIFENQYLKSIRYRGSLDNFVPPRNRTKQGLLLLSRKKAKSILCQGICTTYYNLKSYYTGDHTKWNHTKRGPCGRTGTWTFHLPGRFNTRTFRHGDILAQVIFSSMDFSAWSISAPEHFAFQHLDILAPSKVIWTFRHLCYCAEMSMCQNVFVPKRPWCQKIFVPKSPRAEKSLYRNVHGDEMSMCWYVRRAETCTCRNVPVMKCPCQNVSCRNVRCLETVWCQNGGKPNSYSQTGINFASISILLVKISLVSFPNETFSTWSFQKQTCSL